MAESSTLTIRISENLKAELERAAGAATQSITDYVIRSLLLRMAGACKACGRDEGAIVVQPPAMTAAFDEWCAERFKEGASPDWDSEPCLFGTIEPQFGRRFYVGTFHKRDRYETYISLTLGGVIGGRAAPAVVARQFVVLWAAGRTEINNLRSRLVQQGYVDVEASLWEGTPTARRR